MLTNFKWLLIRLIPLMNVTHMYVKKEPVDNSNAINGGEVFVTHYWPSQPASDKTRLVLAWSVRRCCDTVQNKKGRRLWHVGCSEKGKRCLIQTQDWPAAGRVGKQSGHAGNKGGPPLQKGPPAVMGVPLLCYPCRHCWSSTPPINHLLAQMGEYCNLGRGCVQQARDLEGRLAQPPPLAAVGCYWRDRSMNGMKRSERRAKLLWEYIV
jgi:hypothetical protein